MAARYAATKPEQVAALFLVSPALGNAAQKGAPLPPPVAKRIEELDRLGPAQFAAARAGGLLADTSARPDVLQAVREAMAAVRRPGYDQAARLLAVGRLLDDAAKLAVPTTVLVGEQDRITPPANVRRAFDAVPAAQRRLYREIPDSGHAICQERPDVVARVIAEIVAGEAKADA
jgi:pimeloyl-ACP methyl ester carboxylesterase